MSNVSQRESIYIYICVCICKKSIKTTNWHFMIRKQIDMEINIEN